MRSYLYHWRSEIGIWFVIWALVHVGLVVEVRGIGVLWASPWAFGATISVLLGVILLFTSNNRVYQYLGPKAWKWHQSHATYLIFYMLAPHIWYRAYLIPGFPSTDPLHWMYLVMFATIMSLHVGGFIKVVRHYRRTGGARTHVTPSGRLPRLNLSRGTSRRRNRRPRPLTSSSG